MKTITRRQLSREPASLKNIRPGESAFVPDEDGGLVITRRKKNPLTADEIIAQLNALKSLPGKDRPFDFNALTEDEE